MPAAHRHAAGTAVVAATACTGQQRQGFTEAEGADNEQLARPQAYSRTNRVWSPATGGTEVHE